MSESPATVACAEKVTHRYGDTIALDTVTLDIPAGRMVGFVGPDGVGKSSLLGLIAGARQIQSGRIEVLGGDMADAQHRTDVSPRIAYMPQGLGGNLYPTLSVFENVDFLAVCSVSIVRNESGVFGSCCRARTWRHFETVLLANYPVA